jgi:four helix bundle protein
MGDRLKPESVIRFARIRNVLSRQIVRSGTSIGANIEEAIGGQSDKDFLSKLSIAYKEEGNKQDEQERDRRFFL